MIKIYLFIVSLLILTTCIETKEEKKLTKVIKKEIKMQEPKELKLKLGMVFEELLQYKLKKKHVSFKSGNFVNFYEKRWSTNNPLVTRFILDDKNILKLPHTTYLFITEDSHFIGKGIKRLQLQTGISQEDLIGYEEARVLFHAFLQNLLKQGWKRMLSHMDVRISGRHAMHYKLTEDDSMYYQDPSYEPTLEEWKKLETGGMSSSNYWVLHYKSKVFLEINLGVVPHKTEPNLASYLMFITLRDGEEEAMSNFKGEDRLKWKTLWQSYLERAQKIRNEKENKLKAKGYTIDESYEYHVIDPRDYEKK